MSDLGEQLQSLRLQNGLTLKQLSVELSRIYNYKIAVSTLSQYETNKRVPDAILVAELCKIYKISMDDLFDIPHKSPTEYINETLVQYQSKNTSIKISNLKSLKEHFLNLIDQRQIMNGDIQINQSAKNILKALISLSFDFIVNNRLEFKE